MSERKGSATARGVMSGLRAAAGLALLGGALWPGAWAAARFLLTAAADLAVMSALTLGVVVAWNVASWGGEGRQARRERSVERSLAQVARQAARMRDQAREQHGRVIAAGADERGRELLMPCCSRARVTASEGSYRFAGPPPAVRFSRGTREVSEGARLTRGSGSVVKSECDFCGAPVDVALCHPGVPYPCRECREELGRRY